MFAHSRQSARGPSGRPSGWQNTSSAAPCPAAYPGVEVMGSVSGARVEVEWKWMPARPAA